MELKTEKLSFEEKLIQRNANQKKDWWNELSQEIKDEIEEGERQIERGEFFYYEDIMKKYR